MDPYEVGSVRILVLKSGEVFLGRILEPLGGNIVIDELDALTGETVLGLGLFASVISPEEIFNIGIMPNVFPWNKAVVAEMMDQAEMLGSILATPGGLERIESQLEKMVDKD